MTGLVQKLKSVIEVKKDGAVLFRGRPLSSKEGFYRQQDYTCEGELAFLLDSRVRPFEMSGGVTELFTYLINQHNEQVDEYKRFKVGKVTVTDPNDYINRSNITYETTWDILNTRLLDTLGGYLWVRHEADGVYLDYLADFPYMSTQHITFGENLLDYARTRDGSEIATALIPLGARLEDEEGNQTDQRLTIAEVNGGKDYVYDEKAVEQYGWIFATQTWDDVTQPGNLKQKALDALNEKIKTVETIEMTSADLSQMDKSFDDFREGQYVFVDSPPHEVENEKFLVTKMTIPLDDPSHNKLTFGRVKTSFTEENNKNHQTVGELVNRTETVIQNIAGIAKQKMYRLYLISTGGVTFKNQEGSTVLQVIAYSWDKEVTASLTDSQFQWLRSSQNAEGDAVWNSAHADSGKQVEVTAEDVPEQATFICRLKEANVQTQITITMVQDGADGVAGPQGPQGLPGKDGTDGKTTYFHVKYSAVASPTSSSQMTETPSEYIGTYVDYTEADSTDPKKYTWARFQGLQGEQGIPGTNGTNGKTSYLHIKYSNDGGKTFTANNGETVGTYMGTCVDYNSADPTSVTAYKWAKIKGEQGAAGPQGPAGEDAAIISPTEPEDKTKLWCDTSGEPPLLKRWDGEKWVIVNDPAGTIQQVYEDVYSAIDQKADEIQMEVAESTYLKGEVDQLISEVSTKLTQTAEGWEMSFDQFQSWVESANGENQTAFEELRRYIRFISGNIELGDQNNNLKCIISNEKISFTQNGAEVAYISNNKLYITNAEVLDRFTIGNPTSGYFDWIPRANGNLGMKWRES